MEEKSIPTYKLFGEQQLWPTPEPIHYETIADRSALYDWEITPHSHDNLLQILFLQEGGAGMTLETQAAPLATPCVVMMPPRQAHGFRFSSDVVGHIVTIPYFLLGELLALAPELKGQLDTALYIPLEDDEEALALMRMCFGRIAREYAGGEPGRLSVLMATLGLVVVWLARAAGASTGAGRQDRVRHRIERFLDLIERHFRERQPLAFYAGRLGVSTAQLNNNCRSETGASAQQMLHDRLLLEARRLLAYSDLDVTAISYSLGFRDPAYFSRFFARRQGMSPSAFRDANRQR
ncbi:PobR regulator [Azoarcus olearius]|uniref:helix-turn-helix domain-containing protein n=1 Tax=Azoarcus sp. (strain BH72) TaxID=418699 RepID=UPI0008064050|nr:helix-turn-helix domain-containing protein [Azoarcus olearius]ANQ85621.1 PobR regulator [Azoarcus olearius]